MPAQNIDIKSHIRAIEIGIEINVKWLKKEEDGI